MSIAFDPSGFPGVDGLVVRAVVPEDVEALVPAFAAWFFAGSDRAPAETEARRQLEKDIASPNIFAHVVTYQGRLLKYETVVFKEGGAHSRHLLLLDDARQFWFWRECARPAWEALSRAGHKTLRAWLSSQLLARWHPFYEHDLGGRVVQTTANGWKEFEFDLPGTSRFPGWPERRTLGAGWSWTHGGSGVVVREMAAEELLDVRRDLAASWGGEAHPKLPEVRRLLDEQWALDRATVLLAHLGGALARVYAVRPRRDAVAAYALFSRLSDVASDLAARVMFRGVCAWAQQVRYRTLTSFAPETAWSHPLARGAVGYWRPRIVNRHVRRRGNAVIEIAFDVAAIAEEPIESAEDIP